jgi:hypothetical protein
MEYAVNPASSVLRIDGGYWVCSNAVWYVGEGPEGPWETATRRPDEIDAIPPSNPHYNTKYVYVYDSTPDVVYVGYTPAYYGSYYHGGCIVYGTGWYYTPWYGHYYYPYHSTWGFHLSYNSYYGWGCRVTWSNGPFTISFGGYGGYYPYGGWWGPRGYIYAPVHHHHHYHRPPGWHHPRYPVERGPDGPRRPGDTRPGIPEDGRENLYKRPENSSRLADRVGAGKEPGAVRERANDVFAGRDGNVYRRSQEGRWQQRDRGGWKDADPSRADRLREGAKSRPKAGGLERDYRSRQRGNVRAGGFQRSRGGAGAVRRGGGRRR